MTLHKKRVIIKEAQTLLKFLEVFTTMDNVRLLTEEERKALIPIEKGHGIHFEGGSCEVGKDGRTTYHIGFYGIMATYGNTLGKRVKEALKADRLVLDLPGHQEVLE